MFNSDGIVRFDPGCAFTDPSYFLPSFYVAWSKASKNSNAAKKWLDAASNTREVLYAAINKTTGLGPHSCGYDGGRTTDKDCHGDGNCANHLSEDDAWRVGK